MIYFLLLFTSGVKEMAFLKYRPNFVISGLILIVVLVSPECNSFESNELNRDDPRRDPGIANDRPFRLNKFNVIWQKAKLVGLSTILP